MSILTSVLKTIQKHNMISPRDSVVVALSGGADSLALLALMIDMKDDLGISNIVAAHMNHCLRGDESLRDEKFVRKFCASRQIHVEVKRVDINKLSKASSFSVEETARNARMDFLEELSREIGSSKILLGHNSDDNAETIIMNFLRGSGIKGLTGIPPVRGSLARPLIEIPRADIEDFCRKASLPYVIDSTNLTNAYTRNKVRNVVLPVLKDNFNESFVSVLTRNADLLRDEESYLANEAEEALADCITERGEDGALCLDVQKTVTLHPAIARRVIRLFIERMRSLKDISIVHVNAILELLSGGTGKEIHVPGFVFRVEYGQLTLAREGSVHFCYKLPETGTIYISEIDMTLSILHYPHLEESPNLICTNSFKYDSLNGMVLRSRLPGDRITLVSADGLTFTKKLQDYFTDCKLPSVLRDKVPLLAKNGEIIWILGENRRLNANYRVLDTDCDKVWVSLWKGQHVFSA